MKILIKWIRALVIVSSIFTGAAQAESTWQIGPQFGYSKETLKDGMDSIALGGVARYTYHRENSGLFGGIHLGGVVEFGKENKNLVVDRYEGRVRTFNEWTIDVMPRVGYKLGDLSLSLAGGLSFMYGQQEYNGVRDKGSDDEKSISMNDQHVHTGWKIAPGIDYKLTERLSLFGQFHYAKYGSKTYKLNSGGTDAGTYKSGSLKVVGGRVGVLLAF